ncbi:MAG: cellulose-binding protein, partial [Clostridia bacterium]|nr:cellulose-binding protein [Clostridia bacterium]
SREWKPNTAYRTGDIVSYDGKTYKCIQGHTSLSTWQPPIVPALWKVQ